MRLFTFWTFYLNLTENHEKRQKADIDGRLISPTADRLDYMDFTMAISVLNFAVIQPMPIIQKGFMSPIKPFQPMASSYILSTKSNSIKSTHIGINFQMKGMVHDFRGFRLYRPVFEPDYKVF